MKDKKTRKNQSQNVNVKINEKKSEKNTFKYLNYVLLVVFLVVSGYYYMKHIETLFENDKHFSHLSTLERELSFRTESGLYYYYFKILVSKQTTNFPKSKDGYVSYEYKYNDQNLFENVNLNMINDNRTEYPIKINSLQRFNLYPEIIVAIFYHLFYKLNLFERANCWNVNRGDEMPPITSCTGYIEPIYFYSKFIFILHGFSFSFLFLLAYLLNRNSLLAGLFACVCYIFNHGEATRIMWTPALRESFSYPFHILQLVLVTKQLKNGLSKTIFTLNIIITLMTLLTWQFAQFSLGTQAAAFYFTYILGYIKRTKFIQLLIMHTISLLLCFILMFANRMLLASFFSSILLSLWILIAVEYFIKLKFKLNTILRILLQVSTFLVLIIVVKKFLLPIICLIDNDDTHIWDILKSKLSIILSFNGNYHTFDTRLYTCAKEFDFLEFETITKLTKTFLLPVVSASIVYCLYKLLIDFVKSSNTEENEEMFDDAPVVYHLFQLAAFSLMAFLIMRLKLFWTPQLCIVSTLIFHDKFSFLNVFTKRNSVFFKDIVRYSSFALILALMSMNGIENLKAQYRIIGEYNDYPMESLINWVNINTKIDDSFAGSMPSMANLKLSTNRAIMNHPHYENNDLRTRTRLLYTYLYGYKDVKLLHDLLKNRYKVKYLVVEQHYCLSHPPNKPECAMSNVAHLNDDEKETRTHKQACYLIINDNDANTQKYFKRVFQFKYITVHMVL